MLNISNLDAEIGANFIGDDAQPSVAFSNSSAGLGVQVDRLVATAGATVNTAELVGVSRS